MIKAAYYTGNKTFAIETIDATTPGDDEVQVEIAYCGICGTDLHVYHGDMDARIGNHRVIGHEMSGTVSLVGKNVTNINQGDTVVIRPLVACGQCPACNRGHNHVCQNLIFLGLDTDGAMQQKWTVPSHTIHKLPEGMSLKSAALVEPVAVACHDVARSRLVAGEDVVIIGGGPIGMLIAMVAKDKGANVIVVEVNEFRLKLAESLGFKTINPKEVNVGEKVHQLTNDKGGDVVFEVSGTQAGVDSMTEVASVRGRIVMVAIHAQKQKIDLFKFFWRELEMIGVRVYEAADYDQAIELIANGAIDAKAMITNISELDDVNNAFEELSGNPKSMKSLIKVN